MSGKNALFGAYCQQVLKAHYCLTEHQRPHCKQDERSSLSCSAVSGTLNRTTGAHCTNAEKLILSSYQLAGFSLSMNHGIATFVHEQLRYTLLDQFLPTSQIEWLCVDVDGYKIVNLYKLSPRQLRFLNLPVFPDHCLYAGDFNCRHFDWVYDDNSLDCKCLVDWKSINTLALLCYAKDIASFYSGRWNSGPNPDLPFASVGPNNRLPDRRVHEKFNGHNIDLYLSHYQGLLCQCQACLLSDETSARPNGVTALL